MAALSERISGVNMLTCAKCNFPLNQSDSVCPDKSCGAEPDHVRIMRQAMSAARDAADHNDMEQTRVQLRIVDDLLTIAMEVYSRESRSCLRYRTALQELIGTEVQS